MNNCFVLFISISTAFYYLIKWEIILLLLFSRAFTVTIVIDKIFLFKMKWMCKRNNFVFFTNVKVRFLFYSFLVNWKVNRERKRKSYVRSLLKKANMMGWLFFVVRKHGTVAFVFWLQTKFFVLIHFVFDWLLKKFSCLLYKVLKFRW